MSGCQFGLKQFDLNLFFLKRKEPFGELHEGNFCHRDSRFGANECCASNVAFGRQFRDRLLKLSRF